MKLQNFSTDDFKNEAPNEPNGGNGVHMGPLERQESNSQRTQVQAKELTLEGANTNSSDTSAASSGPHMHTSVLKNPVCQEVGDGGTTDEPSDPELDTMEDNSDEIICQPESQHDRNNGSSLIMARVPPVLHPCTQHSPTDSEDDCIYPTDATSSDPSQLCVGPLNFQESHFSNSQSLSAVSLYGTGMVNGDYQTDLAPPMQDTDRSNSGFMVGSQHSGAAGLPPLPDDVKAKYHQTADKMNTLSFRLHTVEVAGGTPWNREPDTQQSNDMYM